VLRTPREVRNVLAYVIQNWRHPRDPPVGWRKHGLLAPTETPSAGHALARQ